MNVKRDLSIDQHGRVVLSAEELAVIDGEHLELAGAGANGNCSNAGDCNRTVNDVCRNSGDCRGATNVSGCALGDSDGPLDP